MTEELQSERQEQRLPGRIHCHVGGPHELAKGFEVLPHRMYGVGQMPSGEGLCSEQVAELISDERARHGPTVKQRESERHRSERDEQTHCRLVARDTLEPGERSIRVTQDPTGSS